MPLKKMMLQMGGMHCTSCAQNIEKSLKALDGVYETSVNFAAAKAAVEHDSSKNFMRRLQGNLYILGD